MEARERPVFRPFPGSDALQSAPYFTATDSISLRTIAKFNRPGGYYRYLNNQDYREYMELDKTLSHTVSHETLLEYGEKLEGQSFPEYLRAAGSAFVEASLLAQDETAVHRMDMAVRGERIWQRQLVNELHIERSINFAEDDRNEYGGHRTAVSLATMPLVKSIIVGNVSPEVMDNVLVDLSRIADMVKVEYDAAVEADDWSMSAQHKGLLFEMIALMSALYIKDPRYIPLPSTARGGSGLYDAKQTHDIMIFNQHWGDIRKVIPVEIKSRLTKRAKRRYRALTVPGGLQLSVQEDDPSGTVGVFSRVVNGEADTAEELAVEKIAIQFREALRLYQQGVVHFEDIATSGLMRFHSNEAVVKQYPQYGAAVKKHI